jgi:hypothetical protein
MVCGLMEGYMQVQRAWIVLPFTGQFTTRAYSYTQYGSQDSTLQPLPAQSGLKYTLTHSTDCEALLCYSTLHRHSPHNLRYGFAIFTKPSNTCQQTQTLPANPASRHGTQREETKP